MTLAPDEIMFSSGFAHPGQITRLGDARNPG